MAQTVKNLPIMQRTWVQTLGWGDSLEEGMVTHSSISCLENSHGQRSLASYSPWGHKELDTTEQLSIAHDDTGGQRCGLYHGVAITLPEDQLERIHNHHLEFSDEKGSETTSRLSRK